jgi:hypothetical protein
MLFCSKQDSLQSGHVSLLPITTFHIANVTILPVQSPFLPNKSPFFQVTLLPKDRTRTDGRTSCSSSFSTTTFLLCSEDASFMTTFAFLPRPLRSRETRPEAKTKSKLQADQNYPKDIVLKASFAKEGMAISSIISQLEHLVPRSCHYVHAGAVLNGKVSYGMAVYVDAPSHSLFSGRSTFEVQVQTKRGISKNYLKGKRQSLSFAVRK